MKGRQRTADALVESVGHVWLVGTGTQDQRKVRAKERAQLRGQLRPPHGIAARQLPVQQDFLRASQTGKGGRVERHEKGVGRMTEVVRHGGG